MKKQLLIASMMILSGSAIIAQNALSGRLNPTNDSPVANRTAAPAITTNRNVTCGPDTARYTYLKETLLKTTTNPTFYTTYYLQTEGISQAYKLAAPAQLTGIEFYGKVKDIPNPSQTLTVNVGIYNVDAAFMPTTQIATTTTLMTTTATFRRVMFTTPVAVSSNYAIVITNPSATDTMQVYVNNAKATTYGEGLGYNTWGGNWYMNKDATNGFGQDLEGLISPIITYDVATNYTTSPVTTTICLGTPITFTNTTTPMAILSNPAYNFAAFDAYWRARGDSTFYWDMGNGSPLQWSANSTYTFPATGTFNVSLVTFSGLYTSCFDFKTTAITVTNTVPVLNIADPNPAAVCGSFDLTAASITSGSTNVGTLSYWTDATATTSPVTTPNAVTTSGIFYIRAQNGGCSDIEQITLTVTPYDVATITAPASVCQAGGTVTLTSVTSGGTWSGSGVNATSGVFDPSSLAVGPYVISYTTNGTCPATDQVTINVTANDDVTITPTSTICEGSADVTMTAATTGGTWSLTGTGASITAAGVFTPTSAGSYLVTYTTSGSCGNTANYSVVVTALDDATITPVTGTVCTGSTMTLTAASAGIWSGSDITASGIYTPTTAGSQSVSFTSTGTCPNSDSETITVTATEDATITAPSVLCDYNPSVTLTAATAGGTWSSTGAGLNATTGEFDPAVATVGTYTVTYTTAGPNCPGTDDATIVVDVCTGINSNGIASVNIYPNPSNGVFTIDLGSNSKASVEVYNVVGSKVVAKEFNSQSSTLDMTGFNAGIYFIKVSANNGQITKKVTIVK